MSEQGRQPVEILLEIYSDQLTNGNRAELRKLASYEDVLHLHVFYKVKRELQRAKTKVMPDPVLAALLLLWRDRAASVKDLQHHHLNLGTQFANGSGNAGEKMSTLIVKINRFQRLMLAESMEEGFKELRRILLFFKHEALNWVQVTELLSAWSFKNMESILRVKRKISNHYFDHVSEL